MTDQQIIELYWKRDDDAIRQTDAVYGGKLLSLSDRILRCREDAQECVSDTYLRAWNAIPPTRPARLYAFLAKLCRNCSLNRLEWNNAAKRGAEVVRLTRELEECLPAREPNDGELTEALNRFLEEQPRESRLIFLRRYWYLDSVADIARRYSISQSKVKTRLHRTRKKLKEFLEGEGIGI